MIIPTLKVKKKKRLKKWSGFPGGSAVKNPPANAGDAGLMSGLGGSSGEGNGKSLKYSNLKNPMDRGALCFTVHRVVKSWT